MASIPQPPLTTDATEIHRVLTDTINYLRERLEQGTKSQGYTQDQINAKTDLSNEGTIVYNTTTGEMNSAYLDNGQISWRAF